MCCGTALSISTQRWLMMTFWRQRRARQRRSGGCLSSSAEPDGKRGSGSGGPADLAALVDGVEAAAAHAVAGHGVLFPRLVLQSELPGDGALLRRRNEAHGLAARARALAARAGRRGQGGGASARTLPLTVWNCILIAAFVSVLACTFGSWMKFLPRFASGGSSPVSAILMHSMMVCARMPRAGAC